MSAPIYCDDCGRRIPPEDVRHACRAQGLTYPPSPDILLSSLCRECGGGAVRLEVWDSGVEEDLS